MEFILFFGMLAAWIWSVARGIQVSLLCAVLNFVFPPVSQIIYAVYEEKMRAPLIFMVGFGVLLFVLYGEVVVEDDSHHETSEQQI